MNQRLSSFMVDAGSGSPSGGITPQGGHDNGPGGAPDDDSNNGLEDLTQGIKAVNRSVQEVRNQIRTTTGTPLQRMVRLMGNGQQGSLSSEELEEMTSQNEFGLNNIADILATKNPEKADQARTFIQDLSRSDGLSAPELISRAKQEFYPNEPLDPAVETQIVNVSSNQARMLEERVNQGDIKVVVDRAQQIGLNPSTSNRQVNELSQSINVYNQYQVEQKNPTGQSTISPEALQNAIKNITTHTNLPEGTPLTTKMVEDIQKAVTARTIQNPLID
jgi:hypothetical protein